MKLFRFFYTHPNDPDETRVHILVEADDEQRAIEHLTDWNDNQDYTKMGEVDAVGQNIWQLI